MAINRAVMIQDRMLQLHTLRASLDGRANVEIDTELASVLYKRKLLSWMSFPILDLPTEILAIIFHFVVCSSASADQATEHRLRISWVCKRFREVAIADQNLWNSIWFHEKYPWTRALAFVERAGTSPIDICISEMVKKPGEKEKPPSMTVQEINYLLDRILPKIGQIRIVVVLLDDMEVVQTFLSRFANAGPARWLERFEVHWMDQKHLWPSILTDGKGGLLPLSYHPTPNLRCLCLNGPTINWSRLDPVNLRTIDLRRMPTYACPLSDRWTELLTASPDLYNLALDAAGPQWKFDAAAPRIPVKRVHLPNLRVLVLANIAASFALWALAHIYAPGVMELTLTNLAGIGYAEAILRMPPFTNVRLLTLSAFHVPESENNKLMMIRWFMGMPRLRMLKIVGLQRFVLDTFHEDASVVCTPDGLERFYDLQRKAGVPADELVPPVACRALETLWFQGQQAMDISTFVTKRNALGKRAKPIKTVYTPLSHRQNVTDDEMKKIMDAGARFLLITNCDTPEEHAIHVEASASVGRK